MVWNPSRYGTPDRTPRWSAEFIDCDLVRMPFLFGYQLPSQVSSPRGKQIQVVAADFYRQPYFPIRDPPVSGPNTQASELVTQDRNHD